MKEDYIDANPKKGKRDLILTSNKILIMISITFSSIISSSQFKVPSRGYVNLKGPKITLNLKSLIPLKL